MKNAVFLLGILFVAALAPQPARAESNDEKEIRALEKRLATALKAKDIDAIMTNYVDDGSLVVFHVLPPRQYVGTAAYKKNWQDFFATVSGPFITCEPSDLTIMADGNLGVSHFIEHLVWNKQDGNQTDVTIRITEVFRKINDKWLIVHEHLSVPVDAKTGMADFSSAP